MKTKRNWGRVLKRLLAVALSVAIIAVAYNVIYNILATDDLTMRENYENVKAKHESLKEIAENSIEEGQGIRIDQLSKAGVQFEIYNDGENIILYYVYICSLVFRIMYWSGNLLCNKVGYKS